MTRDSFDVGVHEMMIEEGGNMRQALFWSAVVLAVIGLSISGRGDYLDSIIENDFSCSMIQQGHWPKEVASCQ